MSEPATKTATTGIYCQQCGYDLRASQEAKRCPECGRVFSPADPTTFRTRPLIEWRRALGRGVKRGAVLLLAFVLLLAACWGWLYWEWKQEQTALSALAATGADIGLPAAEAGWEAWISRWTGPAGFVVQRVRYVRLLPSATDADLAHLRKLIRLRHLDLGGAKVTDAGLEHLRDLRQMQVLLLPRASITDAGLAHLGKMKELRTLSLMETSITGVGLGALERLPHLEILHMQGAKVTDAGLVQVAKLIHLRYLWLNHTPISDAGLADLAKLPALERLDLEDVRVTDAGLLHLVKLPGLKQLLVTGPHITGAGNARLRAAMPECRIIGQ